MNIHETIRVADLSTGYTSRRGSTVITRSINASLNGGELTCLLGPNGAGKSTLLKTLTAFIPPVQGEVFIKGKPLTRYTEADLAKEIGVVLTDRLTVSDMSATELVAMGRSPYTGFWGSMSADDRKIVDEAINLVGIAHLSSRMVNTLSDGERQKVMIAKAIAQQTPVIFLDEPTAFLDYPSKVEIMQLLHSIARSQAKTIFLSTHDLDLALQIADKIWLIDKALGVTTGTPEDLALSGDMSRYFHRSGIEFDPIKGLFKICHNLDRSVTLTGDGQQYHMVKKALARNGIDTTSASGCDITIRATPDGISLNGSPVATIADLLSRLSSRQ